MELMSWSQHGRIEGKERESVRIAEESQCRLLDARGRGILSPIDADDVDWGRTRT